MIRVRTFDWSRALSSSEQFENLPEFIGISYSCLLTISIAFGPVAPWTTVTWFTAEACAVWYVILWYRLSVVKTQFAVNFVSLINCFHVLKSKCPIFESNFFWQLQNLDFESPIETKSTSKWMNWKEFAFTGINSALRWPEFSLGKQDDAF